MRRHAELVVGHVDYFCVGFGEEWLGGSEEESQLTSNQGLIEQPELKPMPNGYGIVMFPHLLSQLGLAMAMAMLLLVDGHKRETTRKMGKTKEKRE